MTSILSSITFSLTEAGYFITSDFNPTFHSMFLRKVRLPIEPMLERFKMNSLLFFSVPLHWVCYDMNEFNDNDPEIVEIPSGALAV